MLHHGGILSFKHAEEPYVLRKYRIDKIHFKFRERSVTLPTNTFITSASRLLPGDKTSFKLLI